MTKLSPDDYQDIKDFVDNLPEQDKKAFDMSADLAKDLLHTIMAHLEDRQSEYGSFAHILNSMQNAVAYSYYKLLDLLELTAEEKRREFDVLYQMLIKSDTYEKLMEKDKESEGN